MHSQRNKSQPGHTTAHLDRLLGSIAAMTTETSQQARLASQYRGMQIIDIGVYEDADVPVEE